MPQLSLYLDEPTMEMLREKSSRAHQSMSRYVTGLIRDLKKLFLFFTFSTPFSSGTQFDACTLSVRKTVIVYRILIILSQKNRVFYILTNKNIINTLSQIKFYF